MNRRYLRGYLTIAVVLLISYLLILYVLDYFLPFLLAVFFALLIEPVVRALELGGRMPRWLAATIGLSFSFGLFGGLVFLGAVQVINELGALSSMLPHLYLDWLELFNQLLGTWNRFSAQLHPVVQESLYGQLDRLYVYSGNALNTTLRLVRVWVLEDFPRWLLISIFTGVATYFVLRDKEQISRFMLGLLPPSWQQPVRQIETALIISTVGLVKAQLVLVALTFVATLSGLLLLDAPLALTLAVLSAMLDIIPILGPALLFVPWSLYELILGDVRTGALLLLLYGGVSLLRSIAQARVIAGQIGLHPLATLISLYLGLRILGVAGLVAGPLIAILLKAMLTAGLIRLSPPQDEWGEATSHPRP